MVTLNNTFQMDNISSIQSAKLSTDNKNIVVEAKMSDSGNSDIFYGSFNGGKLTNITNTNSDSEKNPYIY
jgi:hypothetical protein